MLACYDPSRRNPLGKEESKEKSVINIRCFEGCYARCQHCQT